MVRLFKNVSNISETSIDNVVVVLDDALAIRVNLNSTVGGYYKYSKEDGE